VLSSPRDVYNHNPDGLMMQLAAKGLQLRQQVASRVRAYDHDSDIGVVKRIRELETRGLMSSGTDQGLRFRKVCRRLEHETVALQGDICPRSLNQVAPGQSTRLIAQPPGPLQSVVSDPARCPIDPTREKVNDRSECEADGRARSSTVLGDPSFLPGFT